MEQYYSNYSVYSILLDLVHQTNVRIRMRVKVLFATTHQIIIRPFWSPAATHVSNGWKATQVKRESLYKKLKTKMNIILRILVKIRKHKWQYCQFQPISNLSVHQNVGFWRRKTGEPREKLLNQGAWGEDPTNSATVLTYELSQVQTQDFSQSWEES